MIDSAAPLFIPVLLGTNRKGSASRHVARWLVGRADARDDLHAVLHDVADFDFPADDYGQAIKDRFPTWRDDVVRADGLILVAPEYNHGYPGPMKAALDLLLPEYIHKPVALVGVSSGPFGGARVIEAMVPMVRELGLACTFTDLNVSAAGEAFDADGRLLDDAHERRVGPFLDELAWMARCLRWGRANLPSKYHMAGKDSENKA